MENNIEKSFPFDANLVNGKYDREYVADDFARYFRTFISSGFFMENNYSLQVLANNDMTVTLRPGGIIIDGYRYDALDDIIIRISPADGLLDRIDRIAITWCKEERTIHYTLLEGEFSYEPVAPACRRTAEYKDYVVADIYIAANSISITQSAITDQRLNSEVCGLAAPFMKFPTTLIFNQLQAFFQETVANTDIWRNEQKVKWEDWFLGIKDILAKAENGELLKELKELYDNLYHMATDSDIDSIINDKYVDEDETGIFETASNEDIDNIIGDIYIEDKEDTEDEITDEEMKTIVEDAFSERRN